MAIPLRKPKCSLCKGDGIVGHPVLNPSEDETRTFVLEEGGSVCTCDAGAELAARWGRKHEDLIRFTEAGSEEGVSNGGWPQPLSPCAYHGPAGEIVRLIEPTTEADPVAILIQILIGFANLIGRSAYFLVEEAKHFTNLFAVLVGRTSKGRKGTAWSRARAVLRQVDSEWCNTRVETGLSSGEGLISAVRDQAISKVEVRNEKQEVIGYQDTVLDQGVSDKRLLVIEEEFASLLKVCERHGNSISVQVRQAWDGVTLQVLTKEKLRATAAHISIIGHITGQELVRRLTETEQANGFANRFLWFSVKRSRLLPLGNQKGSPDVRLQLRRISEAAQFAKTCGEMKFDKAATRQWSDVYGELSRERPGLPGAMASRAEAQTIRLALIYALLDRSKVITELHLRAALEVWRYAEDSLRYVFGSSTANPDADAILHQLKVCGQTGLTRTQISELFSRNKPVEQIDRALALLDEASLAAKTTTRERGRGRPSEVWRLVSDKERYEKPTKKRN
ncbi:MAG: DUF3987 domain-containing protein [Longimicrobiales bacterium]